MRGLFICLLAFMVLQDLALCQNEALRRRRIRKKVIKAPIVENESTILEDVQENIQQQTDEEGRENRGFLDEYYSQFDDRVSQSHVDNKGGKALVDNTNARMDAYSTDYDQETISDQQARDMPNDYAAYQQMQNAAYQQMQMEDLLRQKQENLEAALIQKHMEEELIEEELRSLPTTVQQQHPDIRSGTRYVQHVSLPNNGRPDENAYMYSSVMPDDPKMNEILPAKSMTNYLYAKPPSDLYANQADTLATAGDTMYTTTHYGEEPDTLIDSRFFNSDSPSSSAYGDSGSSSDAVSRFFGITGTTSQDIQLGLTFTVPFLSVPLQSLQSMLGGGGLGDLFDNFSLDSSSVITIVVIGVAAIFVLPQIIYWLTGVNLSAFNWGRMDEGGHGMNIVSVMNMIDESMKKYDVDTRSCMARTMCNQYATRTLQGEEEAVQRISRGLIEQIAQNDEGEEQIIQRMNRGLIEKIANHDYMKMYLGESKVEEALKYGQNGKDCSIYYSRNICPWDTSAMIKIATKVMTSGNIDFASIASAAAANLISSSLSKN